MSFVNIYQQDGIRTISYRDYGTFEDAYAGRDPQEHGRLFGPYIETVEIVRHAKPEKETA